MPSKVTETVAARRGDTGQLSGHVLCLHPLHLDGHLAGTRLAGGAELEKAVSFMTVPLGAHFSGSTSGARQSYF